MNNAHVEQIASYAMANAAREKIAQAIAAAERDQDACFALGVAYSTGAAGVDCDMIEAHTWFNLAAARGHVEAAEYRSEIACEMSAREIAEAQRRARRLLAGGDRGAWGKHPH